MMNMIFVFIVLSLENIAHKYIMGMIDFYVKSKRSFGYSLLFERANIINLSADVKGMPENFIYELSKALI